MSDENQAPEEDTTEGGTVLVTEPVPPAPDAGEPAPEPEETAPPAADVKGPGDELHDAAVAFIIATRTEAVDAEQYLEKKLSGMPVADAGTALHTASEDFIAKGKAMNIDFYEYIRAKIKEITD